MSSRKKRKVLATSSTTKKSKQQQATTHSNTHTNTHTLPDPTWSTLPGHPLKIIYDCVSLSMHNRAPASHKYDDMGVGGEVACFALTCKAFYKVYEESFDSIYPQIKSIFERKFVLADSTLAQNHLVAKLETFLKSAAVLNAKKPEWAQWFSVITAKKRCTSEGVKLLKSRIFNCLVYNFFCENVLSISGQFDAEVVIGSVVLTHYAEDHHSEESYWTLTYNDAILCEVQQESSTAEAYKNTIKKVRKGLNIENEELVTDKILVEALLRALPWRWKSNQIYYDELVVTKKKRE